MQNTYDQKWVNQLPIGWTRIPLSSLVHERKTKNSGMVVTNLLSLSYGQIIRKDISTSEGLLPESFEGYNIIEEGDVVLRLTDLQNDQHSLRVGLAKERGIITSAYVTLQPKSALVFPDYLYYSLHAFDLAKGFYGLGAGVRQGLNYEGLKRISIPLPTLEVQKQISSLLNTRCSEIDSLIAIEEAQIKQLNKYLESISESVFQKICKEKRKIKYVTDGISDGTHGTYERVQNGKYLLSAKNLGEQGIQIGDQESMISEQDYRSIIKNGYPAKNDILMCAVGDIGKVVLYEFDDPIAFQRSVMFIRPRKTINPKFLLYALKLVSVKNQEICAMNKTIQAGLYQGLVKEIWIPYVADRTAQLKIVEDLDEIFLNVQTLIASKRQKISLLIDYKKSLIYECVTGKKLAKS